MSGFQRTCPACGKEHNYHKSLSRYCPHCGARLCIGCGAEIPVNAGDICPNCEKGYAANKAWERVAEIKGPDPDEPLSEEDKKIDPWDMIGE